MFMIARVDILTCRPKHRTNDTHLFYTHIIGYNHWYEPKDANLRPFAWQFVIPTTELSLLTNS